MNIEIDTSDNQSVMSDITENTISSSELLQKEDELRSKTEIELNKLTIDGLKEKCKEYNISGISKLKKPELVQLLISEFLKLWPILKDKKANDLKNICKQYNLKCLTGLKKDELIWQILNYCSENLKFKLDESVGLSLVPEIPKIQMETPDIKKLTLIEELEKQKLEIEMKMKEEIEKQKLIEEEQKRKQEEELKKQEELKKEEERKKEEAKKKKQSIPKNVRIIVWNHYIGEDIIKHRCLCCKKVIISNTNFEVGHVISEKNGGTHEINNLRPICFACNHSMGPENMIDFVVKYGLYIG